MTRAHRTAHAWIWLVAAIALALLIRVGEAVRPGPAPLNDVPDAVAAPLNTPPAADAPAFEPVLPPTPEPEPNPDLGPNGEGVR